VILDAANHFAPVGQFALNPNEVAANQPFGIGENGDIYIADGLGGGST